MGCTRTQGRALEQIAHRGFGVLLTGVFQELSGCNLCHMLLDDPCLSREVGLHDPLWSLTVVKETSLSRKP